MKLASFENGFGRLEADQVVPMGRDLMRYLIGDRSQDSDPIHLSAVRLMPPVSAPSKIICVGLNYRDHALETGAPIAEQPILFAKFSNSLTAHREPICLPAIAPGQVDYEAELAVVIGKPATRVPASKGLDYVAGYTCANDVSARDLQLRGGQWLHGKAIDTFLPMGPWIVTADEIPDPQHLVIECSVNGETLQSSNTKMMIFSVAELVSFISQTITLMPGDIICTGTPAGVGFTQKPPRFLKPGDTVNVVIEGIGELTNSVRA